MSDSALHNRRGCLHGLMTGDEGPSRSMEFLCSLPTIGSSASVAVSPSLLCGRGTDSSTTRRTTAHAGRNSAVKARESNKLGAALRDRASADVWQRSSVVLTTTPPYHTDAVWVEPHTPPAYAAPVLPLLPWPQTGPTPPARDMLPTHPCCFASIDWPELVCPESLDLECHGQQADKDTHSRLDVKELQLSAFPPWYSPPYNFGKLQLGAQVNYGSAYRGCEHSNGACSNNNEYAGDGGVLDGNMAQAPVLDLPAVSPSVAVTLSYNQEAAWKLRCLSVTCAQLPRELRRKSASDPTADDLSPLPDSASKQANMEQNIPETALTFLCDFVSPKWDAVVWRWLKELGMTNDVDELLNPGAQRVLVRWSSDQAAERWRARMVAAGLHLSRQVVFENTLLKWI